MIETSVLVKLCVVAVMFVDLCETTAAQQAVVTDFYDREYQGCGRALNELVRLACAYLGGVYEPDPSNVNKRTHVAVISTPVDQWQREDFWRHLFLGKRSSPGIVEECCYQPCKLRTLQRKYCKRMPTPIQDGLAHQLLENVCSSSTTDPNPTITTVTDRPTTTLLPEGTIWSRTTTPHTNVAVANDALFVGNSRIYSKRDFYIY